MIKYTIYHRRERPSNLLPPSHQIYNLWKSWLLKVINFLLRTYVIALTYILNYSNTYSINICSLDECCWRRICCCWKWRREKLGRLCWDRWSWRSKPDDGESFMRKDKGILFSNDTLTSFRSVECIDVSISRTFFILIGWNSSAFSYIISVGKRVERWTQYYISS